MNVRVRVPPSAQEERLASAFGKDDNLAFSLVFQ